MKKYTLNLISSLKEIIITYLIQYIIIILSTAFLLTYNQNTTKSITIKLLLISIITNIIITTILYTKNKIIENKNKKFVYFNCILIGISISCILNMLIFKININNHINNHIPIILLLISSGLIGPIYEEILFRYIFLNRLRTFNDSIKSIVINTFVFALIHLSIIKIIFAFILGLILNIFYVRYKNIKVPILIHISANTIALFLKTYDKSLLIISFLAIFISIKLLLTLKN